MSIFDTLSQKPWLPSQEKKDNLHTGQSFAFESSRVALICFLGSITALFSLFFVAYVGRMAYGDWRVLPEPFLLWINTGALVISSILFQKAKNLSNKPVVYGDGISSLPSLLTEPSSPILGI